MNGRVPEGGEVVLIADELSRAVELTLNPAVAHEARNQAYNACESFKENSPWCAQAGLLLASGAQYSAVVQHFGLQLMEHTVKYRWTQITQAEKIFIKENAMKLLYLGGWETGHLNDALSRVIVEMIKREWPQQWPTLLSELSDACTQGHVHTQIVLHVFLRLVEDVATLQTLEQNQRRKDIYQALMSNMAEILAFFMRLTELHVQEFREKTAAGDYAGAASNGRVVQTVLQTLAGFAEVVPAALLVAERGLLRALCLLLLQDAFRLLAADALLQLLNRKGSVKERKPLLVLFNEDAISCVHRAALDNVNKPNEENYTFLKKLSQVVVGLAALAAALWAQAAAADAAAAGAWLRALLQAVLLLAAQPALAVAQAAAAAAAALLRHEALLRHDALAAAAPHWLAAAAPKLLKLPFPGAPDAAFYARLDYDNEHDYNLFFSRFRTEVLDTFRYCMMAAPLVTWGFMEQWAHAALDKLDAHAAHAAHDAHELSLEWEALTLAVETATSRLLACEPRPAAGGGLALLARVLRCEPAAAALRSLLLSLLSALVVFLSCAGAQLAPADVAGAGADLLPRVLDKIFAALVFEGAPPEDRRSRSVKNVRRHAASLLVKLGAKYPLLLLPVFPRLHELCRAAAARADLSVLESVTVQEALLLVSNHLCCFERQARLVGELLGDSRARWEALAPHVGSARPLLQLLGLDVAAAPSAGDARRTLLYELTLLLAVVKRTQVPADPDKAARGGFGGGVTESGNPVWRNPCADHVLPLLPHALALLRSLHALHEPAVAALLHADHARVLLPPAAERLGLLGGAGGGAGGAGAGGEASPAERVQGYVHALHEAACALAGAAAGALGRALYAAPGAGGALAAVLLPGELPDAWLRRVLRGALKPLLARCPAPLQRAVAVPLLAHAAPLLLQHLTRRWDYVAALYHDGKLDDAASESQEVLDDILVRHLTREYVDLLKVALVDVGGVVESNSCEMEEEGVGTVGGGCGGGARPAEQVSELGALLLAHADTSAWLLHGVLRALTWGDSAGSLRAAALALPALRAALAAGRLAAGDAAAALAAALQALRAHGQHDANLAALLALALHSYELLRPRFPAVAAVLRAVPGADLTDLQRLDDKLAAADHPAHAARTHKQDKTKRELFKKITSKLIGRNVGQLFKKEVLIVDLPAMPAPGKEPARSALDADAHLDRLFATNAPT